MELVDLKFGACRFIVAEPEGAAERTAEHYRQLGSIRVAKLRPGDTCVVYPGWCPAMDWKAAVHFGGTTVTWFDRWTMEAVLLPAFEHCAAYGMPMHFGEFGVIGYANTKSPRSALCWTRDAVETFETIGADWHLWNHGFGMANPLVRDYVTRLWSAP